MTISNKNDWANYEITELQPAKYIIAFDRLF